MSNTERKYRSVLEANLFIDKVMEGLDVDKSYMGYYFIIDIMDLLINKNLHVRSFSREVYPIIAEKYDKKLMSIERDIRNFIDKNWNEKMKNGLSQFWSCGDKPTCCKFIFMLKNYILSKVA